VFAAAGLEFKQAAKQVGQQTGRKGPGLFMPLRAALTGATHGPELGPLLALLSHDEVQARLDSARRLAQ
jgi:glutamyl/glutaminyl-tRNA synthetase